MFLADWMQPDEGHSNFSVSWKMGCQVSALHVLDRVALDDVDCTIASELVLALTVSVCVRR